MYKLNLITSVLLPILGLTACKPDASSPSVSTQRTPASAAAIALPNVVVHKSVGCECCAAWVRHLQQAGFNVEVRNEDNMEPIKKSVGIPATLGSCHTAQVGGYFVEGHVPAEDVKRLLAEHPDAKGLTVPGMPAGSPGMELPSRKVQPYDVYLVAKDGTTSVLDLPRFCGRLEVSESVMLELIPPLEFNG